MAYVNLAVMGSENRGILSCYLGKCRDLVSTARRFLYSILFATLLLLPACLLLNSYARAQSVIAAIDVGSLPGALAVNPSTNLVYVVNNGDESISVIDGKTNQVVDTVNVGFEPAGIGVNSTTNRVYVSRLDSKVRIIDGETNTVVTTITVGRQPSGIGVNSVTNRIYVNNTKDLSVSVIDGNSNTVVQTVDIKKIGAELETKPTWIGVNTSTNLVYVPNPAGNVVHVIDGSANSVIANVEVEGQPSGIGVNPVTNRIYVVNITGDTISIIEGSANSVIGTVSMGGAPQSVPAGASVNPATNSVYVTGNSNKVSVIDGSTNLVTQTVKVGSGSSGVCVNPATGRVYVVNVNDNTVSVIDMSKTSSSCASSVLLDDNESLDDLRTFRDGILSKNLTGLGLIKLYYKHSAEVTRILESDPKLKSRAADALKELVVIIKGTSSDDSVVDVVNHSIPAWLEKDVNALFDEISMLGSEALKDAIRKSRASLYE